MTLDKNHQRIKKAVNIAAHISYWSVIAGIILTAAVYQGYQNKISG